MSETMGMGIGINNQQADEGKLKGYQKSVACGVWFTSTGRIIPHTIKYEDKEELINTLSNFSILLEEDKFYCGIPATQFLCEYIDEEKLITFWLLYYHEEKKWKMWFKH